ncbi:MAG: hypothetical protein A3J80_09000 [Desulfobacula sp. RIFOXYB2_FULL_45_6]|nr:MAG: hypothetical protein A3J80_09000 [Desulfobacula sp. RIFOXYB2_FULL_45_6]
MEEISAMGPGQKRQEMKALFSEMKGLTKNRLSWPVNIEEKKLLFFFAFFFFFSYINVKSLLYLSRSLKAVKL